MARLTEWSSVGFNGRTPSDPQYRVGVYKSDDNTYGNYAKGFGSKGFLPQFAYGTNEVRHFIGFFATGESLGLAAAEGSVYYYVGSIAPTSAVDQKRIALGLIGAEMGANLAFSDTQQLSQDIWRRVCGQPNPLNLP
jgi:hypothetical protein